MRPDTGWATAQVPTFVSASPSQKPTFVHPHLKALEAESIRAQVEAFINGGGNYQRIEQPTPRRKRNGRGA